jgi:hypothetical protein
MSATPMVTKVWSFRHLPFALTEAMRLQAA